MPRLTHFVPNTPSAHLQLNTSDRALVTAGALFAAALVGPAQERTEPGALAPQQAEKRAGIEHRSLLAEKRLHPPADVGTLPRAEAVALGSYPVVTQGAQHALIREGIKVQLQPSGAAVSALSQKPWNNRQLKSGGRSFSSDLLPMPRSWASAPEASGLKSLLRGQLLLSDLKLRPPILATREYPHPFL